MNPTLNVAMTALGAVFAKLFKAGAFAVKFCVCCLVAMVVVGISLIGKVARDIFITTYPR